MKTILALIFTILCVCTGWVFWSEHRAIRRAEIALRAGDGRTALHKYERLHRRVHLLFVERQDISIGREHAALVALQQAVAARDFIQATHLVNLILDTPESGTESEARSVAATLPDLHLDWAMHLLETGDVFAAARQCATMRQLYAGQPQVLVRVRVLEWRYQLVQARGFLREGDLLGVFRVAGEFDPEAPLPLRAEAENLILTAVRYSADTYYTAQDYPGLYRFLAQTKDKLQWQRPHLLRQMESLQEGYDRNLFGRPATREAEDIAPAVAVDGPTTHGLAVFSIQNNTGQPLTVIFRGLEAHQETISPGAVREVALPKGEYVQFAYAGSDLRPHLAIIQVGGQTYRQIFEVSSRDGTAQHARTVNGAMLAKGHEARP